MADEIIILSVPGAGEFAVEQLRDAIEFSMEYADIEYDVIIFGGELEPVSKAELLDQLDGEMD